MATVTMDKPKVIVTKILGVTTSKRFMQDLEAFFARNVRTYLEAHWGEASTKEIISGLRASSAKDRELGKNCPLVLEPNGASAEVLGSIVEYLNWSLAHKRSKSNTALNDLQGCVWGEGYQRKLLKAHMYPEVGQALEHWKRSNMKLYTFSAGAVGGQQNYFINSIQGNISGNFSGHISAKSMGLDKYAMTCWTTIVNIVSNEAKASKQILLLTSSLGEAKAAVLAGLSVCLVLRDGKSRYSESDLQPFPTITDFNQIQFQ